ncbi:MAG: TIGR00268 family protein [Acidimicrobiaceae bacterium]|jgi:uncharacterized protein|nr:TIGR00268 family protein [Acidimicrobiaceae bacterium]|tara:strand:+ start:3263 stop:4099 length:837 start_codon:yes stop_codon:yes gene_type:complete
MSTNWVGKVSIFNVSTKEKKLLNAIRSLNSVVIAFSGGVDSSLVAKAASKALSKDKVLLVTADSQSLGSGELEKCEELSHQWNLEWMSVQTNEFENSQYIANQSDRCWWCKSALMDQLEPIATQRGANIVLGVNQDDLGDHRPGQEAAKSRGAKFPLVEAGLTKHDVRELAKEWELSVWDRPSMPCLSSRIPYETKITVQLLSRVDRAENILRSIGVTDVRVRDYQDTARIEVCREDLDMVMKNSAQIHKEISDLGYRYVTLDLGGLRSGNLNAVLKS